MRRPGFGHPLNFVLHVLPIAGRNLVYDDQVEDQAFGAKIFLRTHQLLRQAHLGPVADRDERNRQIAGDAELPQFFGRPGGPRNGFRHAKPRVGIDDPGGEPLKPALVFACNAEMTELDLAVRAGQREGARGHLRIVILLDERADAVFVLRHDGGERHARGDARGNPQADAQADDGIEHGAR